MVIPEAMSQQPDSSSSLISMSTAPLSGAKTGPVAVNVSPSGSSRPPQRIPRWLERVELFLRVMLRMYIGLAVCYAPWSPRFWDQNPIFQHLPALAIYAESGVVRGLVSGLGLLNLWIAFRDAVHYREQ